MSRPVERFRAVPIRTSGRRRMDASNVEKCWMRWKLFDQVRMY